MPPTAFETNNGRLAFAAQTALHGPGADFERMESPLIPVEIRADGPIEELSAEAFASLVFTNRWYRTRMLMAYLSAHIRTCNQKFEFCLRAHMGLLLKLRSLYRMGHHSR
jgi:hypothetical protein